MAGSGLGSNWVRAAKDDGRGMEAQYKTAAVSEAVMKSAEVEESREVNS
jgi:hypothetical protein